MYMSLRKKILLKRNMYRNYIARACLNRLTKLIGCDMEINCSSFFLMPATLQMLKKRLLNK